MTAGTAGSIIARNYSVIHKTLMFLIRLAWRSRIALPYLIMIGFMVLDIRLTLEIIIDVEHQTPEGIGLNQGENESDSEQESENHPQHN